MTEREAYIGFASFPGIGPQRFKLLVDYFGSAEKAWTQPEKTLVGIGLGPSLTGKFLAFRTSFSSAAYEKELLRQEIKVITRIDDKYPVQLKEIADPPIALFVKGILDTSRISLIGVVGTRKPTSYGRQITVQLTRELVSAGLGIVSGMARGIDSVAHRTCLEARGYSVAVLGCGVDIVYPPENSDLYGEIINSGGAVVSEVPPGHTVLKGLFPARNRIISGLSLGVVVTEGAQDSGSLITAKYAAEQGREVFAVPGPITSYLSAGPTKLIKQGAKLVTQVTDILEELNIKNSSKFGSYPARQKLNGIDSESNGQVKTIVDLLSGGEMHYDEIIRQSNLPAAKVGALITQLELSGIIRALGNGKYGLK